MLGDHQLRVDLWSEDGTARPLYMDAEPVVDFMAATLRAVPTGSEVIDLDSEIEQLLSEEGA
jgi:hypothetical protein